MALLLASCQDIWILIYAIYLLSYSGFCSDVSSNNIVGEIPFGLPPNVTHM